MTELTSSHSDKAEKRRKMQDGDTSRGRITTQTMAGSCSKSKAYRIQPSLDAVGENLDCSALGARRLPPSWAKPALQAQQHET